VLEEACRQARSWRSPLTVSVNVSPGRLRSGDLCQHTADILGQTELDPARLTLELSERTLFDDEPEASFGMLSELATSGVGVALDDFGAGYASLGHLRRLPLTQLKIDRSLVATLGGNGDLPIVAAVTSFAHALGLSVTAEGIENPAQLDCLVDLGCDLGQGFLFGQPEPAGALSAA
jgi:EAL domain-containing protein (putative c-di-GMP-specific phosphodiesterase class I)